MYSRMCEIAFAMYRITVMSIHIFCLEFSAVRQLKNLATFLFKSSKQKHSIRHFGIAVIYQLWIKISFDWPTDLATLFFPVSDISIPFCFCVFSVFVFPFLISGKHHTKQFNLCFTNQKNDVNQTVYFVQNLQIFKWLRERISKDTWIWKSSNRNELRGGAMSIFRSTRETNAECNFSMEHSYHTEKMRSFLFHCNRKFAKRNTKAINSYDFTKKKSLKKSANSNIHLNWSHSTTTRSNIGLRSWLRMFQCHYKTCKFR